MHREKMIYLLGHGRSRPNEAGLVTGAPVDVLSDEALAQGALMAAWLPATGIAVDRHAVCQCARASQKTGTLTPPERWTVAALLGETADGGAWDRMFVLLRSGAWRCSVHC
ncbi:hypothetical protein, partial [Burkholderia cenocepacia]|uniref:hypothetical protein n=1 Tax=Burkholderia cenocepacia TaxID=95486 RepID=UPI00406C6566